MRVVLTVIFSLGLLSLAWADNLTISLDFPKRGPTKAFSAPKPIEKPLRISGSLTLDMSPYPVQAEDGRYTVQYFLDDQLLNETNGFIPGSTPGLSFVYVLDTTKYENGRHKLAVNFWDNKGASAIGIKPVIIDNTPVPVEE